MREAILFCLAFTGLKYLFELALNLLTYLLSDQHLEQATRSHLHSKQLDMRGGARELSDAHDVVSQ